MPPLAVARISPAAEPPRPPSSTRELIGASPCMQRLFAMVPRLAASDATVLIEGETGTGKSVLAERIHRAGPRAGRPWIVVDCGSIPPTLVESVLFGHERGAFTGASAARAGAFEAADGGTVFLDEIGELPAEMQPKLLRLLETKTVTRIGRVDAIPLDVRIIAATHRDLRDMVNRGQFRADLFYRLNVVRVSIPPLRERREDIELLFRRFHAEVAGREPAPELLADVVRRDWRGNIRELRHAVESAALLEELVPLGAAPAAAASPAAAPPAFGGHAPFDPSLPFRDAKERMTLSWERWYLHELISRAGGNLSLAARQAQMDRRYLRELLRQHGIR